MSYSIFIRRYAIIAAKDMSEANDKAAAAICFAKVGLEEEQYRLGHTKVFFRSGVIGYMEEKRDERIQAKTYNYWLNFWHTLISKGTSGFK